MATKHDVRIVNCAGLSSSQLEVVQNQVVHPGVTNTMGHGIFNLAHLGEDTEEKLNSFMSVWSLELSTHSLHV